MNRSALQGASATVALLVGLGFAGTASAANSPEADTSVQRVRQHVQSLIQAHGAKLLKANTATSASRLKAGVVLAAYTPEQGAVDEPADDAEGLAEDVAVEVSVEPDEGGDAGTAAVTPAPEPSAPAVQEAQAPPQVQAQPQPQTARAESRQEVAASAEVPPQPELPGVLTKRGTLIVEPSVEYTHTDVNQFSFGGVAILDTVLVGAIEAHQANRDAVTATLGMRYGITNRFEGELRIPYMYRDDNITNTIIDANNIAQRVNASDNGLGDIEGALHYQFNDGTGKWPVFVGNLRVKSTTGTGPYDVQRNAQGIEEELATGSGFWGIEPSLTVIAPSDPAVFFANIGYLWNIEDSVDKQIGNRFITDVDPGDAVRLGVGMGLALNEKVSFSVGYQHDFIMSTKTKFSNGKADSDSLSVGSLTFGVNWQMSDNAALNVSVGVGVTNDSPDVRLMARVPIAISLF